MTVECDINGDVLLEESKRRQALLASAELGPDAKQGFECNAGFFTNEVNEAPRQTRFENSCFCQIIDYPMHWPDMFGAEELEPQI